MTQYRVIAPVVLAKTMTRDGMSYVHIQQGGTVPSDVSEEWIKGHLHVGMIVPIAEAEDPPPAPAPASAPEPEAKPAARRATVTTERLAREA